MPGALNGLPDRVVVIGPCAAGKSTLVDSLRGLGYDAVVSGQEHSDIPTLWRRARPSVLIALSVDVRETSHRRSRPWPEALHDRQRERLRAAFAEATAVIDTSAMTPMSVLAATTRILREKGVFPVGIAPLHVEPTGDRA
ncbi:MAG: hypothetical protein M3462_08375 [Chloroflexota bacterium]|nr:hypothetical protein [Chloroflexota bacterium]